MAIDIGQRITNTFPATEANLRADADIDYQQAKQDAVAEAKRKAYGRAAVPAEADIPDVVGEWIADQATIRLIPLAKEHYSLKRARSRSNEQGENETWYDLLGMLDALKAELERECAERWPLVEDVIGRAAAPSNVPKVSVNGLILDPLARAVERGVP